MRKVIFIVIVSFALAGCGQVSTFRQSAPVSDSAGVTHQIVQKGDGSLWVTYAPLPLHQTTGITQGPDGKMWFTQQQGDVGSVDMNGTIVRYFVSQAPLQIIVGPDRALWFAETRNTFGPYIGRITTSGKLTEYQIPFDPNAGLAAGSDGNIWVAGVRRSVEKVTLHGVVTNYPLPHPKHHHSLLGLIGGPDGNVWFTDPGTNEIGFVTPHGKFTLFEIPTPNSGAAGIALGPDGNLYFAESQANKIGVIDRVGNITEYPVPASDKGPHYISAGYSGTTMWFDDQDAATGNYLLRQFIIATKTFTPPILPPFTDSVPEYLNAGPDGNMWIADVRGRILVALTHVLTSNPDSVVLSGVGQTQTIQIHETQYEGGSFTAKSSNQNIATVSAGNQSNSFVVTAQGAGSCSIHVRDQLGNSIDVRVTIQ